LVVIGYFFIAWLFVGKDPAKGEIHLRTSPPENISPALMRYVLKMKYDDKMLTCALVSMANKGYLSIEEKKEGFSIVKNKRSNNQRLSADEKKVAKYLVSNRKIMLTGLNYKKIKQTVESLEKALKEQSEKIYFYRNTKYYLPGLLISFIYLPVCIYFNYKSAASLMCGLIIAAIFLNFLFLHLLKAPTKSGRKVLDEIEGFKKYLLEKKKFAERSTYSALETHYERYLAYAIALDIEDVWENTFNEVASTDEFKPESRLNEYCPGWYLGGSWSARGCIGFAHSMGHSYVVTPPPGSGCSSSGGGYGGGAGGGGAGGGSGGGGGGGF